MTVKTLIGLIESVVLAATPWIAMLILVGLHGEPKRYLTQAGFHMFLLLAGGSILLTITLLLSVLLWGKR